MSETLKEIFNLKEHQIEDYVINKVKSLDGITTKETYGGNDIAYCTSGWINSKTVFLPSATRKKGFTLDSKQLYIDFIKFIQRDFKGVDFEDCDIAIRLLGACIFMQEQFDTNKPINENLRNQIYQAQNIGEILLKPVNVDDLRKKSIIRCIEKSAILNNLMAFLDMDSSIIFTTVTVDNSEPIGHALCLFNEGEQYVLVDPSFYTDTSAAIYPAMAFLGVDTLKKNKITFNISEYGESFGEDLLPNQSILIYDFPSEQYINNHNISHHKL